LDAIKQLLTSIFVGIHSFVPIYGLAIIIFTLLLKVVLLPFNIMQTKSTVKMQMVQPKLKELQKKYKNDPKKMQEAQMKLYKDEGVNPFGGCLPLIIQMPVLFAIFWVFRDFTGFGTETFLGLTLASTLNKNPQVLGIFFALLSGFSTFISTLLLTPKGQEGSPATGKNMNIIMSAFFAWVSWTMPASLVIYWIVNNLLQMGIQYFLNNALRKRSQIAAENK
jgi:YidC/Oxa1 family membrane protein insertase